MKKYLLAILTLLIVTICAYADNAQEARQFFDNYVNEANNYSDSITKLYSPSAKIIRQVVKPDGSTVNVYTDTATYVKQLKIGQAGAKLRQYKNFYSNVIVTKLSDKKFKISSLRQPIGEQYKLKTYMIIQKQSNGKWIIVEEMMQTKQQIFLRYAK